MAVSITLYNYGKEANRLDKSSFLNNAKTVSGTFRGGVDMVNPTVEFYDSATILPDINDYNYMKIEYESGETKYYFINDIFIDRTHVFVVSGHVDVLMSYKDDIDNLTGVVQRSENKWNGYLLDPLMKTYQYTRTIAKKFTGATSNFSYDADEYYMLTTG